MAVDNVTACVLRVRWLRAIDGMPLAPRDLAVSGQAADVPRATVCLCAGCVAHAGTCGNPTLNGSRCLPCTAASGAPPTTRRTTDRRGAGTRHAVGPSTSRATAGSALATDDGRIPRSG